MITREEAMLLMLTDKRLSRPCFNAGEHHLIIEDGKYMTHFCFKCSNCTNIHIHVEKKTGGLE